MTDKEPLKITLEDLGLSEPAATPEKPHGKAREAAEQVGQRVAGAMK